MKDGYHPTKNVDSSADFQRWCLAISLRGGWADHREVAVHWHQNLWRNRDRRFICEMNLWRNQRDKHIGHNKLQRSYQVVPENCPNLNVSFAPEIDRNGIYLNDDDFLISRLSNLQQMVCTNSGIYYPKLALWIGENDGYPIFLFSCGAKPWIL